MRLELRPDLRADDFLPELLLERPFAELRCALDELLRLLELPRDLDERAVRRCELEELLFFALLFFALLFFAPLFLLDDFLRGEEGTLSPSRRASDRPIAIACLGFVTFFPLRPLFSCPRFISCISSRTFSPAFGL